MLPQVTWIFLPSKHAFWRYLFADLHVKTVKYFKSIERVQDEVEKTHAELKIKGPSGAKQQVGSMEWLTLLVMWVTSTFFCHFGGTPTQLLCSLTTRQQHDQASTTLEKPCHARWCNYHDTLSWLQNFELTAQAHCVKQPTGKLSLLQSAAWQTGHWSLTCSVLNC